MEHFSWLGHFLGVGHEQVHIPHAAFTTILLTLFGFIAYLKLRKTEQSLVPPPKVSVATLFEVATENLVGLTRDILGEGAERYLPLVGSLFIFIFINNLLGLVPGFVPSTGNINTTLAMGVVVFFYFNYVGIKTQGLIPYFKHFGGPIVYLAPLMFVIEFIGITVRPLSLGLRLFGNMTGDHLVLGIFSDLVPLIVPILFLALGVFVCFIQAFVFTLLTIIYISLSLPHEEH